MKSFTSMLGPLKKATEQQIDKWSSELNNIITTTIQKEALKVEAYVHRLRSLNPTLPPEKLAKRIINRRSCKAGGIGAICGLGGFLTMPITMPADHGCPVN